MDHFVVFVNGGVRQLFVMYPTSRVWTYVATLEG